MPFPPIELLPNAPGCFFSLDPFFPPRPGVTTGVGTQEVLLDIPVIASLLGFEMSQQWIELNAAANALGITSSDRLNMTIGEF